MGMKVEIFCKYCRNIGKRDVMISILASSTSRYHDVTDPDWWTHHPEFYGKFAPFLRHIHAKTASPCGFVTITVYNKEYTSLATVIADRAHPATGYTLPLVKRGVHLPRTEDIETYAEEDESDKDPDVG